MIKFTLNPFKNWFSPKVYYILDKKTGNILEKFFAFDKKKKEEFSTILKEYKKRGEIELKKHNTFLQNLHGYSKYTELNGEVIPIIEYEYRSNKDKK